MNVQFISNQTERYSTLEGIRLALRGGCRWIQLRMKDVDDETFLFTAKEARCLCRSYGAKLILDDRVRLVEAACADGVHLGHLDMPIDEARQILGPNRIIGGTANTFEDIQRVASQGADYIGCGPLRFTTTKKNLAPLLGFDGYRKLLNAMHDENIHLPLVAIGGLTAEDLPQLQQIGVDGIAVSGYVLNVLDPVNAMKTLITYGE